MGGNPLRQVGNVMGSVVTGGQKNNVFGGGGSPISGVLDHTIKIPLSGVAGQQNAKNGESTYVPIDQSKYKSYDDAYIQNLKDARARELAIMRNGGGIASQPNTMPQPQVQPIEQPHVQVQPVSQTSNGAKGAQQIMQGVANNPQNASSLKGAQSTTPSTAKGA